MVLKWPPKGGFFVSAWYVLRGRQKRPQDRPGEGWPHARESRAGLPRWLKAGR